MNKADLVNATLKNLGLGVSRAQAERSVDAVLDAMRTGLRKDRMVQLVGFGTLKVVERKPRIGVNPKTGEKIKIKGSKNIKFSIGKELKAKINSR